MRLSLPLILAGSLLLGACTVPNAPATHTASPNSPAAVVKPVIRSNALPLRTDAPDQTYTANRASADVMLCLQAQIKTSFRLPEAFIGQHSYDHQAYSVGLMNPISQRMGITLDVTRNTPASSTIKLYANGSELSRAWQNLPKKCL
ncbi:MAG: hypothetical protein KBC57_03490 [Neisseriaceae bacterium]|nr:hypothetical protein [Neisseriaceae bacterium]MBP6861402.1 hypothetical protein [Neisseriaceae bacterium]